MKIKAFKVKIKTWKRIDNDPILDHNDIETGPSAAWDLSSQTKKSMKMKPSVQNYSWTYIEKKIQLNCLNSFVGSWLKTAISFRQPPLVSDSTEKEKII